jgi:imidazolonepropionase-like amidohydrolase
MMARYAVLGAVLLSLAGCGEGAEMPAADAGDAVVLSGATLIDGTGGPPIENAIVVVRGDRIEMVGPAASVQIPAGLETIDLTGKTIMPGIVTLHIHLAQTVGMENAVRHFTEDNIRNKLNQYARYGVLHVLSQGHDQPLIYDIRQRQREGNFPGARVYTAGKGFGVPGGYPPLRADATDSTDVNRQTDPESARAAVRELAAHQPDFVKMWVDPQFYTYPEFNRDVYAAIIDEAHQHGLRVGAHIHMLEDAHGVIDAGVDGLLHSVRDQPVDSALIEKMRTGQVFTLATLVREESMFTYAGRSPYLDDPFFTAHVDTAITNRLASAEYQAQQAANPTLAEWGPALEMAKQNLKTLFDAGVLIGFGADSGPPARIEGYFEHREMELMVEAGLTPAQVIEIATRKSAEILGIAQDYGTVEAGKVAEFLILGANPLENISNTKTLEQVWQNGERVF